MREHEHRSGPSEEDHSDLVRRLDELSNADAQRVLERAIRIQTESHQSGGLSREQIETVAAELGVGTSALDQALREELGSSTGHTRERGWPIPRQVRDRATVKGSESEVSTQVIAWMEGEEGLRPVARTGDGLLWEPDSHWTTSARLALGSDSTKALRAMPRIRHRQVSVDESHQVVEIEVDTGRIRTVALSTGVGIIVAGAATGAGAAALGPGNDLVIVLSGLGVGLGVGAGATIATARIWAANVRKGISRALHGIAHPELHRRAMRRLQRRAGRRDQPRSGFQRVVDTISDTISDILDD